MATLSISNESQTSAYCSISGLGNPFNTTYYKKIVVATGTTGEGSTTAPSGIVLTITAPSSGSSTSANGWASNLPPGEDTTLYAYAQVASDGRYYSAGDDIASTLPYASSLDLAGQNGLNATFYVTYGNGADYIEIDYRWDGATGDVDDTESGDLLSITFPDYGKTYTVSFRSVGYNGKRGSWYSKTITTEQLPLDVPTFDYYSATATSITVYLHSVPNADSYTIVLRRESDGTQVGSKTITGTSTTFTNLASNTEYYIAFKANGSGTYSDSDYGYEHGLWTDAPQRLATPSAPSVDDWTYTTVDVSWYSVPNASSYKVRVYNPDGSTLKTVSVSGTSTTITGLMVITDYGIAVMAVGDGINYTDSNYSLQSYFTTLGNPYPPVIDTNRTVKGENSVRIYWDSRYDCKYDLRYKKIVDSTWSTLTGITTTNYNVTGLTNGVAYEFQVRAIVNETGYTTAWSSSAVATPGLRPSDWEWFKLRKSGDPFDITAQEWNEFTSRINQFRVYKQLSEYGFTIVRTGDIFTASIFNQAVTAIDSMNPPVQPPLARGSNSKVLWSLFEQLRDSINSII